MNRLRMLALVALCVGCASEPDYEFRNDVRPEYRQNVSVARLQDAAWREDVVLLDVRLGADYAANPVLIPGAVYRNPENISEWSSSLPSDKPVVVYCVKGKWVSQKAANYLSAKGYDVFSLTGGIEAWQAEAENR